MNEASKWRWDFARRVAPVYAANPRVAAVILGGSTGRGHADRFSDVELGVFWRRPPTDTDREAAADAIDGDLVRLYPYDPAEEVWSDDYMLGLNRVCYFGFKWLDVLAARLAHKPPDLVGRLGHVYQVEPAAGAEELAALVEETYDLIETHLPEIDVAWLRQVFRYRRPVWEQAPPY